MLYVSLVEMTLHLRHPLEFLLIGGCNMTCLNIVLPKRVRCSAKYIKIMCRPSSLTGTCEHSSCIALRNGKCSRGYLRWLITRHSLWSDLAQFFLGVYRTIMNRDLKKMGGTHGRLGFGDVWKFWTKFIWNIVEKTFFLWKNDFQKNHKFKFLVFTIFTIKWPYLSFPIKMTVIETE